MHLVCVVLEVLQTESCMEPCGCQLMGFKVVEIDHFRIAVGPYSFP